MRGEGIVPVMDVNGNNGNGGFGGYGNGDWAWIIVLFLIFGWGRNGFGNGFGGNGCGANTTCATPADVYNAVDQQTLISKLDQQTYGLADTFTALNNTLNNNFRSIDNAICTLGYQNQQGVNALSSQLANCCCTVERGIDGINYNNAINTSNISRQISDCCCNLEKMNMQNRFDAQTYNCNTLQAIDKLGDRIIDRLTQDKIETLTSENQSLRLKASQEAQNNYLISQLKPCPDPAYIVPNPNCCYNYAVTGFGYGNGCNGCGNY